MQRLAIGIIKKTHGVRGYLRVKSLSGEIEHFLKLKTVYIRSNQGFREYPVTAVQSLNDDVLVKLEGVDNPEDGQKLRGLELWVEREYANPLYEDEYYIQDLCQCRVFYRKKLIGHVKAVVETGESHILEVVNIDERVVMIPFQRKYIDRVEVQTKCILLKGEEILSNEIPNIDAFS